MGSPMLSGGTLLSVLLCFSSMWTQELRDRDALCNEHSCLVLYRQHKIFLDSWRSCKNQGGNLVTIRSQEEANMVETLFSNSELRENQHIRVWIGLQRQPRKCSTSKPMRGFSWITGEQDTLYTNWESEDSPNTCSVPRCVGIGYTTASQGSQNNLKWKDGPCSIPVDGYLCRFEYAGMCQLIRNERGGNTLYTTPFHLVTAFLAHIPFGSVAVVPCLTKDDQTVLCTNKEDGTVGWNSDPPYCSDAPKTSQCRENKGGCHHFCIEDGDHYYCDCNQGFVLAQDGMTCVQIDPCQDSPCEFECLTVMDSYRCACPEGYMLAPNEQGCLDVDECLQSPCEHICINAPGSFECRCRDGFQPDEEGTCEDVDECIDSPCEHACENVMGSHICHCRLGFEPLPEDPSHCLDIDECQIEGTCEQMCINYNGGFECYCKEGYELHRNGYSCRPITKDLHSSTVTAPYPWMTSLPDAMWDPQGTEYPWSQYYETQDGLTHHPVTMESRFTNDPQNEAETSSPAESSTGIINVAREDLGPQTIPGFWEEKKEAFIPSTTSTVLPDYYEDESTTTSIAPPTTTVAGGAWAGLWYSTTPKEHDEEETVQNPLLFNEEYDSYGVDADNNSYNYESFTFEPQLSTSTPFITFTQGTEEAAKDGNQRQETKGTSWLLVGLLVPLSIFIVVMVALGIVYFTRCTTKPQNKNATDCYHWIAGAGDKAAADMAGGGITKV